MEMTKRDDTLVMDKYPSKAEMKTAQLVEEHRKTIRRQTMKQPS